MDALRNLQDKMIDVHSQLKQITVQQRAKERGVKECALITETLQPLPPDARMFKAVGRAYFLEPKDWILTKLKETSETCEKDIEALRTGQAKLESELKEIEQNLQEMSKTAPESAPQ